MANSIIYQRDVVVSASLLEYARNNKREGFFNDITIVAGNEEIPANRLVLSCYSAYLEGLFKTLEREKKFEHRIEMRQVDEKTMKTLIDYIYEGSITITNHNAISLLKGAEYLRLEEIKQVCFEFLQCNISPQNSLSILRAAASHNNKVLEEKAQEYISNNFDKVYVADNFNTVSKNDLLSLIRNLNRSQVPPTSIYYAIVMWTRHEQDRQEELFELFQFINVQDCTIDFLKEVVLKEPLVNNNHKCELMVLHSLVEIYQSNTQNSSKKETENNDQSNTQSSSKKETENNDQSSTPSSSKKETENNDQSSTHSSSKKETKNNDQSSTHISSKKETKNNDQSSTQSSSENETEKKVEHTRRVNVSPPKILSLGGRTTPYTLKVVYSFQNEKSTISFPSLPRMFSPHGSLLFHNFIFSVGADDRDKTISKAWRLNIAQKNAVWEEVPSTNKCKKDWACLVYNEALVVVGGCSVVWPYRCTGTTEYLELDSKKWNDFAPLSKKRSEHALVHLNGYLYALGGFNEKEYKNKVEYLASVERLSSLTATSWEKVSSMHTRRRGLAAVCCRGEIYAIGGQLSSSCILKSVEKFDATKNRWINVKDMNTERHGHATCVLQGKIYVVGGLNKYNQAVKEIECYDPANNTWKVAGEVSDEQYYHSLIVL